MYFIWSCTLINLLITPLKYIKQLLSNKINIQIKNVQLKVKCMIT